MVPLAFSVKCLFVSSQSARETKAASHVLQAIWTYKELRGALNKAGWTKSHFKVQLPNQQECWFLNDGRGEKEFVFQ